MLLVGSCILWFCIGYQGAGTDAEQLADAEQLFDAALGELGVVALDQPCLIVGDFNVEPTKIPCLAKGISAGLWVDLESAWAFASGKQPGVTCKRTWGAAGGHRRDFMVGFPFVAAAVASCSVQQDSGLCLILLSGPTVSVPGGAVRLLSLFGVRLFGLLFGCLLWIEVGAPSLLRFRDLGDL